MGVPLETITSYERMTEAEAEAYGLLVSKHRQARIDPRKELIKPRGPYSLAEIEEDETEIGRLEIIFKEKSAKNPGWQEVEKRAELFEAMLGEGIELNDWFGEDAGTILPARYDDIKNGIDILVEFSIGGFVKYLGLSIDVTTSPKSALEKIDKIRRDIQNGHLARLKYFASEATGDRGVKNDIPRVVIGADFKLVRELAGLWLNLSRLKEERRKLEDETGKDNPAVIHLRDRIRKLQQKMAEHRTQFQILEEVRLQLKYFIDLAQSQNQGLIVQKYGDALKTINSIIFEKKFELPEEEKRLIDNDVVFQAIMNEIF